VPIAPIKERLKKNFSRSLIVSEREIRLYSEILKVGEHLSNLINDCLVDSREKSLALTKVEEAVMWSGTGLERNGNRLQSDDNRNDS